MLGLIASKPLTAAGASPSTPSLTGADLVGLWLGNVRVPGHTEMWQFVPKVVHYQKNGTSVTVYVRNTVLFEKSGTFVVTTEGDNSTPATRQYKGHYDVTDMALTMAFEEIGPNGKRSAGTSFRYTLLRYNDKLQLGDSEQPAFGSLLERWSPRKGGFSYQGPSGQIRFDTDGGLRQSYQYAENGITHYADVYGHWRLVRPSSPHGDFQVRMEGVRDGADFKTITVPLEAVLGLSEEVKQTQDSPTVILYSYSLELIQVADTKPTRYVWAVQLDSSMGWLPEPAPVPPPTLYPSLVSPDLQQFISRLPRKTRLVYAPRGVGFGLTPKVVAPDDPEYGLKDFALFCKNKGVRFDLNYTRF